jgi:DNA-binding NtrC family response regulator
LDIAWEEVFKDHPEGALEVTHHDQSQAARISGLPLSTLRSRMKKLGIDLRGEKREAFSDPLPVIYRNPQAKYHE